MFPLYLGNGFLTPWPQMSKILVLVFHGTFLCQQLKANAWNKASMGWYFSHIAHQCMVICSSGPAMVSVYLIPLQGFSA